MKLQILKILIILNTLILIISLGIIYYKYTRISFSGERTQEIKDLGKQDKVSSNTIVEKKSDINIPLQTQSATQQQRVSLESPIKEEKNVIIRKPKFVFFSKKAKKVSLIGDFNNWVPQPMKKVEPNKWELVVEIPTEVGSQNKYLYNFLVDGKPILDPNNKKPPELSKQGFKSSVLELK